MNIVLNGERLDYALEREKNLGDVMSQLDAWLSKSGLAILTLAVDGKGITPESFAGMMEAGVSGIGELRIEAGDIQALRLEALERAGAAVAKALETLGADDEKGHGKAMAAYREAVESFSNLFSPEDSAFLEYAFHEAGHRPADWPARAKAVAEILAERAAEIERPREEILRAAAMFDGAKEAISEIPLLLQTGRDREAMKTVFAFTEIMGKLVRVAPGLSREGVKNDAPGGDDEFYRGMNGILKELMDAFERKDSVLAGDLAEYEVVPRLEEYFSRIKTALGAAN